MHTVDQGPLQKNIVRRAAVLGFGPGGGLGVPDDYMETSACALG